MRENKFRLDKKRIFLVVVSAVIYAVGIRWFLDPLNFYTNGFAGIAMIASKLIKLHLNINVDMGPILIVINIPLLILGYRAIGKNFTYYSGFSILLISVLTSVIPIVKVSSDALLCSVFGGTLTGIGIGLTLYAGASMGGVDILSLYISLKQNKSIGRYILVFNAFVIGLASILFGFEIGLYTIINTYVMTVIIDKLQVRYQKLTLNIITSKPDYIISKMHGSCIRGITKLDVLGTYHGKQRTMLYTVISSYEWPVIKEILSEANDGEIFVNIYRSKEVVGIFRQNWD